MTSTNGGSERLDSEEPRWLQGSRVVRRWDGLEEIEVLHSVESVTVGGSNVVNRGEQRFLLSKDREWQIQLLLYSAQFSVRDALFRFPVGSAIHLEYPDGRSERLPLESGGELMLESLPRGEYHVSVDGPGISFSRPVALSRDQEVRLELISYLDIAVVFLLVASVALGLLFMGRPRLLFALRTGASRLFLRQRVVRRDDSP